MIDIAHFIALDLPRPDTQLAKSFYEIVKASIPDFALRKLQNPGSDRSDVAVVARPRLGGARYIVPMTRNPTLDEGQSIAKAFDEATPEGDWSIRMPEYVHDDSDDDDDKVPEDEAIGIDPDAMRELCTTWAKRQHERWMSERAEHGWRYGTSLNLRDKTNPLMRSWNELPEHARAVDEQDPQGLVDLLNAQGFMVVSKAEVEALFKLMRRIG